MVSDFCHLNPGPLGLKTKFHLTICRGQLACMKHQAIFKFHNVRFSRKSNMKDFTIYLSCFSHHNSYSSEVYFTQGPIQDQIEWLTTDLKQANKPENRAKRPWIIAFGHRPMYCSNIDRDDCTTLKSVVRNR